MHVPFINQSSISREKKRRREEGNKGIREGVQENEGAKSEETRVTWDEVLLVRRKKGERERKKQRNREIHASQSRGNPNL
jgi:hypothetical protein